MHTRGCYNSKSVFAVFFYLKKCQRPTNCKCRSACLHMGTYLKFHKKACHTNTSCMLCISICVGGLILNYNVCQNHLWFTAARSTTLDSMWEWSDLITIFDWDHALTWVAKQKNRVFYAFKFQVPHSQCSLRENPKFLQKFKI